MGKLSSHALPHPDEIDKKILFELEQDSRRSLGEIARKVKLSKQTLHYRIQRLAEGGVISGFMAMIDPAKLGYIEHEVWMQMNPLDEKEKERFIEYLAADENMGQVEGCEGKFDLKIVILAENLVKFNSVLNGIQRKFPEHVKNYSVSVPYERTDFQKTYLKKTENEKRQQTRSEREPKRISVDGEDLKILHELSKNARIQLIDLAKSAGVSPNTARQRIERLEKEGAIKKYTIGIELSKIGMKNYEILVNAQNITEEDLKNIEQFCCANVSVASLRKAIGKWDIEISFVAVNSTHFQNFLTELRSRFSNIIKEFEYVPILYVHKMDYMPLKWIQHAV